MRNSFHPNAIEHGLVTAGNGKLQEAKKRSVGALSLSETSAWRTPDVFVRGSQSTLMTNVLEIMSDHNLSACLSFDSR